MFGIGPQPVGACAPITDHRDPGSQGASRRWAEARLRDGACRIARTPAGAAASGGRGGAVHPGACGAAARGIIDSPRQLGDQRSRSQTRSQTQIRSRQERLDRPVARNACHGMGISWIDPEVGAVVLPLRELAEPREPAPCWPWPTVVVRSRHQQGNRWICPWAPQRNVLAISGVNADGHQAIQSAHRCAAAAPTASPEWGG